jgi:hypothetical protein
MFSTDDSLVELRAKEEVLSDQEFYLQDKRGTNLVYAAVIFGGIIASFIFDWARDHEWQLLTAVVAFFVCTTLWLNTWYELRRTRRFVKLINREIERKEKKPGGSRMAKEWINKEDDEAAANADAETVAAIQSKRMAARMISDDLTAEDEETSMAKQAPGNSPVGRREHPHDPRPILFLHGTSFLHRHFDDGSASRNGREGS